MEHHAFHTGNSDHDHSYLNRDVGVFSSTSDVAGLTLNEWTEQWWTFVLQSDATHNIVIGSDPADAELGDVGAVHLLGGLFAPADADGDLGTVTRAFHVDRGDAILVPVLNTVDIEGADFGTPDGINPITQLNEFIGNWINSIDWANTHLFVDGNEVDLASHLVRTDVFSMGEVRKDTVASASLGAIPGTSMDLSMAAGVMVMLEPLSYGAHDIAWEGTTHALTDRDGASALGTSNFHYGVHDTVFVG